MTKKDLSELSPEELAQKLNLETGPLSWQELQPHFARGVVIVVDNSLDLIETAVHINQDNAQIFEDYITQSLIVRALDTHAIKWDADKTDFWSVVIAPWVLVQEKL